MAVDGQGGLPKESRLVPALIYACFLAPYAWLHLRAGLTLPLPWPDESSFLWPAIALARDGTLLAPEMNDRVHMMWMPPAQMVVNGAVFTIFGFSLSLARALSAIEVALAAGLVGMASLRGRAGAGSALLCGFFLIGTEFVVAGNVARMEALVLLAWAASMALMARGAIIESLCVAALSPLVHPNGVFVLGAQTGFVLLSGVGLARLVELIRSEARWGRRLRRSEWAAIAFASLCLLAYGSYVGAHIEPFMEQMGAQFGRKLDRDHSVALARLSAFDFVQLAVLLGLLAYGTLRRRREGWLLLLVINALAAFAIRPIGREMWYAAYAHFALLLTALGVLEMACDRLAPLRGPLRSLVAAALMVTGLLALGRLPFPPASADALFFAGMRVGGPDQRIDPAELDRVAEHLRPLESDAQRTRVSVYPRGLSLLLYERLHDTSLLLYTPPWLLARMAREKPRYRPLCSDVHVLHVSPVTFPLQRATYKSFLKSSRIDPATDADLLFRPGPRSAWFVRVHDDDRSPKRCADRAKALLRAIKALEARGLLDDVQP